MNQLAEWIARIVGAWKFWVIVAPWEIAVRVRLGRNAVAMRPGPHWRIPFIDALTLVNTRLRVTTVPATTVQDDDSDANEALTRKAVVGYRISDPLKALQRYDQPAVAVMGLAQAELARGCDSEETQTALSIAFKDTGVEIVYVQLVENVRCPTFRLLQDSWTVASEHRDPPKGLY